MLRAIAIKDFAIIDNLELDIGPGMTVITGETGAGKSIVINALDIALGDKADSSIIREGATRCEINVVFDISHIPAAKTWLSAHELASDNECLIRRLLPQDGRSRNFINGTPVTLQQLRELGPLLIHIHGQHEHQALLKKDEQRDLLDHYARHSDLLLEIKKTYHELQRIDKEINFLSANNTQKDAQKTLLNYQITELETLALQDNELNALHQEHKQLTNAEALISTCQQSITLLNEQEDVNVMSLLHQIQHLLSEYKTIDPKLNNTTDLLQNASIQIQEAIDELQHYLDKLELNPQKLDFIEKRLSAIYDLARKHKTAPERLLMHYQELSTELKNLMNSDERLTELTQIKTEYQHQYQRLAANLSKSRKAQAKKLQQFITEKMQTLGMQGGKFAIDVQTGENSAHGTDKIEFLVAANVGQSLQPLAKVASGGELSRVSLAIQVITAQTENTPTLVFDEVDVGIGGATAAIVGKLLKQLSAHAQVLCITHLPQVASCGEHHLKIAKKTTGNKTLPHVKFLNQKERVNEIARMLGGVEITVHSLAHAEEMLLQVS